jgi:hypothetical protein
VRTKAVLERSLDYVVGSGAARLARSSGMAAARITTDLDLPPGVAVTGYHRHGDGRGFAVDWPRPERRPCDCCGREAAARTATKDSARVVRDLDLWGEPSFRVYRPACHRRPSCRPRQHLIPPLKRRDVSYTPRFERHAPRAPIGSTGEGVARRLGIPAETAGRVVRHQSADARAKRVEPGRVVTDVGIGGLRLKKRHQPYVTTPTDRTDADHPGVPAVAAGRDEAAGRARPEDLTAGQRRRVQTCRADRGPALNAAGRGPRPNARAGIGRSRVAELFHEAVARGRGKHHPGRPGGVVEGPKARAPLAGGGVPAEPGGPECGGTGGVEGGFGKLPRRRIPYEIRVRLREVFETAAGRRRALRAFVGLWLDVLGHFPASGSFTRTFAAWRDEILNDSEAGQTGGPAGGSTTRRGGSSSGPTGRSRPPARGQGRCWT